MSRHLIALIALSLVFLVGACDRKGSDNAPPSPVTLATPTDVTHEAATLTWTRSLEDDFASYEIHAGTHEGFGTGPYTRVGAVALPDDTAFTATGLSWDTEWYFKIRVLDESGLSSLSNEESIWTLHGPPTVEITSPTWGSTVNGPMVTLEGTISDTSITNAFANVMGLAVPISVTNGTFNESVPMIPGANYISVEAAAEGGATGADTVLVNSNQYNPPVVTITAPAQNDTIPMDETTVAISGTVSNHSSSTGYLFINDNGYYITESGGSFSDDKPIFAGDNTIVIGFINGTGFGTDTVDIYSLQVIPWVRVQLTWDTDSTDMDLHVVEPDGEHIYWMNRNDSLDGIHGWLDVDDVDGYGPENYRNSTPMDGVYQMYLRYYSDHGHGPTDVIVKVFLDEILTRTYGPITLYHEQEWNVFTIDWPSLSITTIMAPRTADMMADMPKK